jgi:hypothetical protein
MAIITCSECGRAVSDKAATCIGCGAPLVQTGGFDLVPRPAKSKPLTRAQIKRVAAISGAALLAGGVLAKVIDAHPGGSRLPALVAALLIIGGLCGVGVALVHATSLRR